MDAYKMFNWGLLILTFSLMIYLGYLSSKYMNKDDEGGFLLAGRKRSFHDVVDLLHVTQRP
jgi:sodium/pantothenate symporter